MVLSVWPVILQCSLLKTVTIYPLWNTGFDNIAPLQSIQHSGFSLSQIRFPFQGSIPHLGFFPPVNAVPPPPLQEYNALQTYK